MFTPLVPRRRVPEALALVCLLALAGTAALAKGPPDQPRLVAARIDRENIGWLRMGGPDAIGGLGDWGISNGTLCAVVSDPEHESVLSDRGGVLVDLGHCGRNDDQFGVLQSMVNLSRDSVLPNESVNVEMVEDEARIVTTGRLNGLVFSTRYALGHTDPTRLRIDTTISRESEGERLSILGDISLHGHRQLTPFTFSTQRPQASLGFAHPAVDVDDALAMVRAIVDADVHVLVGGHELEPGIAYGWRLVEARLDRKGGDSVSLPFMAMNGEHFSMLGAFARPFWIGGGGAPGVLELAQMMFMDLAEGDQLVYQREIIVGDRADVASVTDQLWRNGPLVRGRVDDPTARIDVVHVSGAPTTHVRPEPSGHFAFRLPPPVEGGASSAHHRMRIHAPDGRSLERALPPAGPVRNLGAFALGAPARLNLPSGTPMRLVFVGIDPTPTPRLGDDLLDFRVGAERIPSATEANHVSLAGARSDPEQLLLPPGSYRVLATRGPEWSVTEARVVLAPGAVVSLDIDPPRREVAAPGWLSADFHVHAEGSDDSALPLRRRIAAFAAQGADVIVATEHDRVIDYGPTVALLGLQDRIATVVGVEVTSTVQGVLAPQTIGHSNAFPLPLRPLEYRGGAPRGENLRLRSLAAELRGIETRPVLQLNHPREGGFDSGLGTFFSHLSLGVGPFDPTLPLSAAGNRSLIDPEDGSGFRDVDFDAIELLNGPSMTRYRMTRADWFSLLLQGEFRTGTANSDSHRVGEVVALPRNYVAYTGLAASELDQRTFIDALRIGRVYGSTGPLIDARLSGRGPGERFVGAAGTLELMVRSAEWVPVREARVYVNGQLARRVDLATERRSRIPLEFDQDAFVTVEVEGGVGGPAGEVYARLAPGFTPFAFTNPIFVDHDADGRWTAPGLPTTTLPTLGDPTTTP